MTLSGHVRRGKHNRGSSYLGLLLRDVGLLLRLLHGSHLGNNLPACVRLPNERSSAIKTAAEPQAAFVRARRPCMPCCATSHVHIATVTTSVAAARCAEQQCMHTMLDVEGQPADSLAPTDGSRLLAPDQALSRC